MNEDIPKQIDEQIQQLVKAKSLNPGEVRKEYRGYLEQQRERGVSNPHKRALRQLGIAHKGSQRTEAEEMRGVVLGASDAINTSASAVRRAKDYVQQHGVSDAVQKGLVKKVPSGDLPPELASITVTKGEGEDAEKTVYAVLDSNDNSPNAGEVLAAEDYIRYVHGAVWRNGGDGPHLFTGVLDADDHGREPPVPPMFETVSFEAVWVGDSDRNNTVRLRFRSAEPFAAAEGGPSALEVMEDAEDYLGHTDLESADADHFGRNDVVITYGTVDYMELSPGEGQSRRLALIDPFAFGASDDLSRTVWLPDHAEVNYGTESDVYVVAQVSPSNNEYPDSLEALGVYPHPDYVVDRSDVKSMAGDDASSEAEDGAESAPEPEPAADPEPEPEPEETGEPAPPADAGTNPHATSDEGPADEAPPAPPEAEEASTDGGVPEEDRGDFEPTEEDGDWEW